MEVKIKQVNRYEITIGDTVYDGFEKVEEWMGMIKFSGKDGDIVVEKSPTNFNSFLSNFLPTDNKPVYEFSVVKISSQLLPKDESARLI